MVGVAAPDRILILEDEPALVEVLAAYLRDEGFAVCEEFVWAREHERTAADRPTLIILDLNLPKTHGSELFERLRRTYRVPIVVLTSRIPGGLAGSELGADAYIGKPFNPRDVVKCVKMLAGWRSRDDWSATTRRAVQHVGALEIDRAGHEVRRRGVAVSLTPTEFRILETLAAHIGQTLTREQLIDRTARDGDIYDRTLDRHVGNLRHKIEDDPPRPTCIVTVHAIGYRMVGAR